ncbi:hypothetical protein [Marinitoga sp. 1155]|uniref:hypothetical protein n=1 Tax=Marinitoga sp. 1155 TaxID=1428448 RepID=UPI000640F5BA|nr:hypothetical protein [Marinitoga sp. 1155]KLO22533.1 hypothetical protein X274_07970 [Marinitoga sp. 1155]
MKKLLILFILVISINIFSITSINPLPFIEEGNLKFEFVDKAKFSMSYEVLNFVEVGGGISITEGITKIKINTNPIKQIPLTGAISLGYFPKLYSPIFLLNGMIGYKDKKIILSSGVNITANFSNLITIYDISSYNTAIWNLNNFTSINIENLLTWTDKGVAYSTVYLYLNGELKDILFIKNIDICGGIEEDLLTNNLNFIFGASIEIDIPENIKKLRVLLEKEI